MPTETVLQHTTGASLRQRAEARTAAMPPSALPALSPDDVERLTHDLRVHQIELELQNEELLRAQAELDRLRARYFDLSNLAPVGYLTLSEKGAILEANLRAAELLGLPRENLVKRSLSRFIHPDDADVYNRHTRQLWRTGQPQTGEVRLAPRGADATAPWVRLDLVLAQEAQYHAAACHAILRDITERERMEQALRESEARYRLLFETMAQGVVYQSADGEITAANPAAERILGLTLDQMQGRTSADPRWRAVHPDGSEFSGETHPAMAALHTGQPVNDVIMGVFSPTAGAYRWLSISATPQFQPGADKPHQVYATFTDITQHYRDRAALAAREEQQRLILDHLSVGVVLVDHAGTVSYVNPRFTELFGFTRAQIPTLADWWLLAHPEPADREQAAAEWRRRLAEALGGSGEIRSLEMAVTCADGAQKYVRVTARVIDDFLLVTFVDLTERRAAEDAVRASEERYRDLYENAPVAYFSVGTDGCVRRCNQQAAQLLGYAIEQLAGRPVLALYADTPHGRPRAGQMWRRFLAGEPVVNEELQMARADGTLVWVSLSVSPVLDAAGQVVESRSTVFDITARKEMAMLLEARVQARTAELQAEIAERERVRQALAERVAELTSLQDLGQLVSFDLSLEEVIRTYLERLVTLAGLDMARVFLLREGRLHLAGACSPLAGPAADSSRCGAQNDRLEVGECLCGLAVQAEQTVYAGEIDCDPRCTNRHCHADGLHSLAALPLRSGEIVIGALVVASTAPDAFAGRLAFLETAAYFIAGRLQNALLHQEIRDRAVGLEELVTERTRELQTERDRTGAILETVGESVVVTDLDGQVLFANPATAALTGYSRDETVGRPIWRYWSASALQDAWPAALEALHGDRAWNGEISGCRKDSAAYTFAVTGTPLHDADAGLGAVGAVWVQRDITTLKEAARLKDQFVSNVSHELRTPVSIIALGCGNLSTFYDRLDESQRREIIHDIEEQARVLSSLVSDTLLLSQIDAGRTPTARSRVDLARLVRDEANGLRQRAGQRGQHLSVSAPAAVAVLGNERQLRQVVRNLLDNAIKYTPDGQRIVCTCEVRAGGPDPAADAAPPAADAWAVVEIADEGIGIAAQDLPHLFQRFYRVNNESETAGTGLGLSLARELVQLHGGRITVASTPGQGSTFTVYLPVSGA